MTGVVHQSTEAEGSVSPRRGSNKETLNNIFRSIKESVNQQAVPKSEDETWYVVDKAWWEKFEQWGDQNASSACASAHASGSGAAPPPSSPVNAGSGTATISAGAAASPQGRSPVLRSPQLCAKEVPPIDLPASVSEKDDLEFELVSRERPSLPPLKNAHFLSDEETKVGDGIVATTRSRLKRSARPNVGFELVPQSAWEGVQKLNAKLNFGIDCALPRKVVYLGDGGVAELKVETHPRVIHFYRVDKKGEKLEDCRSASFGFSCSALVAEVQSEVQQSLLREADGSRAQYNDFRFLYSETKPDSINSSSWVPWSLDEVGEKARLKDLSFLDDETYMLVELKTSPLDPWPRDGDVDMNEALSENVKTKKGLTNLGNTCFMASAVQCLLHIPDLKDYFLSGKYEGEINKDNPLGKEGQLATAFAKLMHEIFRTETNPVRPTELKWCISRFNPMFSGYQQQDSQELMAFLMDGLHEDLNRVIKKPYTDAVEGDDSKPDGELAQEAWDVHCQRNRSQIVDLMQSQYKSRLKCPRCGKVSITFDPFMYLSVPLPNITEENALLISCNLLEHPRPIEFAINVPKNCSDFDVIVDAVKKELTLKGKWTPPVPDDGRAETGFLVFLGAGEPKDGADSFGNYDDNKVDLVQTSYKLSSMRTGSRLVVVETPKLETNLNKDWRLPGQLQKSRAGLAEDRRGEIGAEDQCITVVVCRRRVRETVTDAQQDVDGADDATKEGYAGGAERQESAATTAVSTTRSTADGHYSHLDDDGWDVVGLPIVMSVASDCSVAKYHEDVLATIKNMGLEGVRPKLCTGVDPSLRRSLEPNEQEDKLVKDVLSGTCSYVLADFDLDGSDQLTIAPAERWSSWEEEPARLQRDVTLADCFDLWGWNSIMF